MLLVWVLIAVCLVLVAAVSFYAIRLSKRLSVAELRAAENMAALQNDLTMVTNASMGVGQRLILVEKKLRLAVEKQQQMELNNPDYHSYNQAASMVRAGADVDQLVERYGLPEAEASLLSLLKAGSD